MPKEELTPQQIRDKYATDMNCKKIESSLPKKRNKLTGKDIRGKYSSDLNCGEIESESSTEEAPRESTNSNPQQNNNYDDIGYKTTVQTIIS